MPVANRCAGSGRRAFRTDGSGLKVTIRGDSVLSRQSRNRASQLHHEVGRVIVGEPFLLNQ
jgi:hypothetical protein